MGREAPPHICYNTMSDIHIRPMNRIQTFIHTNIVVLLALLSVVLVIACSSEEDTAGQPEVDILSRFNSEGKAWMSLDINMPIHDVATRSSFENGAPNEYAVKTMMLVLFHGDGETTEDNMTVASTYVVDYSNPTDGPDPQVTNHKTVTIQVTDENIRNSDRLAVLVIANASPGISSGDKFSTIKALISGIVNTMDETDYFVMSNARLAKAYAANAELFTLVNIDASYFFPTEEESRGNPAGHINIERLAVKTTVEDGLSETNHKILGNEYATFTSNDLTFALDNYNTTGYLCKHLTSVDYERMVESEAVEPYYPYVYRTYWAEDANYSGSSGLTNVPYATYLLYDDAQKSAFWKSTGSSVYCAENTFDVGHMQDNCTTSVLVRLKLNNGGDFYTTSVTGGDIVFQPPGYTLKEQGTSASSSFARTRSDVVTYDGTNTATIDEYLRQWLMETNSSFRNWVNTYAAGEVKHVVITLTNDAATGTATVSSVTQTARASGTTGATAFDALGLDSYFASNISLKYYASGYCYYRVPIRHFDDTQTPWVSAASMTNNSTAQVYGTGDSAASNYLGRYGVVRNNWYNISITSVTHVGSPIIPVLTTDADDKVEQLLNATLQISSWTTHEQNL